MSERADLCHLSADPSVGVVDLFSCARPGPSALAAAGGGGSLTDAGFSGAHGWRYNGGESAGRHRLDGAELAARHLSDGLTADVWTGGGGSAATDAGALDTLALLGVSLDSALSADVHATSSAGAQLNGWPDRSSSDLFQCSQTDPAGGRTGTDPFSQHSELNMGRISGGQPLGAPHSQPRELAGSGRVVARFDAQTDSVLHAAAQLMRHGHDAAQGPLRTADGQLSRADTQLSRADTQLSRADTQLSRHSSDSGNSSGPRDAGSLLGLSLCSTCDDSSAAVSYQCVECNDHLCYNCACAHRRVRLTRQHTVLPVGGRAAGRCRLHQAAYTMVCASCELPLCYTCALDHAEHSLDTLDGAASLAQQRTRSTQQEAQAFLAAVSEARQRAVNTAELVRKRSARAQMDAAAAGERLRQALAAWQTRLEKKAVAVCQMKVARLHVQADQLDQLRGRVLQLLEQLSGSGAAAVDSDAERIVRGLTADHQLRLMMSQAQLAPAEDANVRYSPAPGAALEALLRAAGSVETAGSAAHSLLLETSAVPVLGRPYQLMVQVRDHYGDERRAGDDRVQARVVTPDRRILTCDVEHVSGGRYRTAYVARTAGEHTFSISVNGTPLQQSPWTRRAVSPRRLSTLGMVRLTIGSEGAEPGQLCRPWGVAFGADGRLVVSDRSNHRIQVFAADGRPLLSFGGPGNKNGELNRPAGVCIDATERIVVADKDNHRVCVFTSSGEFLLKFGEKGSRLGLFNYPWDVAVNGANQIAVSDTRNHRVQLFSPDGVLLKKFGQDGVDWKELDSPRGLCFHPDGRLYITDFNNHRVVALDMESGQMAYLCREGTEPGRLLRPQGIAADEEGRLYVADCRNSRVQILTTTGECLMQLGEHGSGPGQFDQPQGVAIGPSGQLAVVCLENHRVQLF